MEIRTVKIEKPEEINFILGQSHFIKTVEDLHEALATSVAGIKFGIAFCEASGSRLIRFSGTDDDMTELAIKNAENIAAGHSFIIFMKEIFPINVLGAVRNVQEVCGIFCATANKTEVIIGETEQGRGILGVIDGEVPAGVEKADGKEWRSSFLRKIGYKL